MTTWLLFGGLALANTADGEVSASMSLGGEDQVTQHWATPMQIAHGVNAGDWAFPEPEAQHKAAITVPYTEAEYDPAWWNGSP